MAVRVQDFPKNFFCQSSIQPMPHFPSTTTAWWNFQEQQFPQPLSKSLSLKMGSSPQACQGGKHAGHQPQGQDSSSTQSTDQPHQEVAAVGGNNYQDQCISSDTAQDESYTKQVEGQVKPVLFLENPSFGINSPQVDVNLSMAHIPYAFGDPYVNGLYTAYGPQAIIQPHVIGIASERVPLPIELEEEGPIYVNAKQYNGILRRRQIRAKLEAQNKLLKNRKPYLHESRHRHALNRVRGSGGRFLSTKKPQPPKPTPPANFDLDSGSVSEKETGKGEASPASFSSIMCVANNDVIFEQPDHMFSNISSCKGGSRGLMCNGPQHR